MTEVRPTGTRELDQQPPRAAAIDPRTDAFPWPVLGARLHAVRAPLRGLLLDPDFMVGLSGPVVDEILWTSGLRHDRRSDSLSAGEVRRLYRALRELPAATAADADLDLTDDGGDQAGGDVADEVDQADQAADAGRALVAGAACRRCRSTLVGTVLPDGDTTSYCPKCQS
jgi:formamidopyrimidine-DNA glycosylase